MRFRIERKKEKETEGIERKKMEYKKKDNEDLDDILCIIDFLLEGYKI